MYLVGTRGETMDNIKAIERSIITLENLYGVDLLRVFRIMN